MSQARRRAVKKKRIDSDDEDYQSQATQGRSQASQATQGRSQASQATQELTQIDALSEQRLVANTVKYILCADQNKVPIQKKHLMEFLSVPMKRVTLILSKAKEQFTSIFGYELLESDGKLMLINLLDNKDSLLDFENLHPRYTILFFTLLYIYMAGGKAMEEALWTFFRNLGILNNNHFKTEEFGDIADLIMNQFVKEKYLNKLKSENSVESTEHEFEWGQRAKAELTYRSVLEFVSKMYNGKDMNTWRSQYNQMLQQEGN